MHGYLIPFLIILYYAYNNLALSYIKDKNLFFLKIFFQNISNTKIAILKEKEVSPLRSSKRAGLWTPITFLRSLLSSDPWKRYEFTDTFRY